MKRLYVVALLIIALLILSGCTQFIRPIAPYPQHPLNVARQVARGEATLQDLAEAYGVSGLSASASPQGGRVCFFDKNGNDRLDDAEILEAVEKWISGEPIDGKPLTDEEILEFIGYWISGKELGCYAKERTIEHTFEASEGTVFDTGTGLAISIPPTSKGGKAKLQIAYHPTSEQIVEDTIQLRAIYDLDLTFEGSYREGHPPVTLTFEIPLDVEPNSVVILHWEDEEWALAPSKDGPPGGTLSSDGRYISVIAEQLSKYAISEWLWKHIFQHLDRLPQPPPLPPRMEKTGPTPDPKGRGQIVTVSLESPAMLQTVIPRPIRELGYPGIGVWYKVGFKQARGVVENPITNLDFLAPGKKRDFKIIFSNTGGHITITLDIEGALLPAIADWAGRLGGVPREELRTLVSATILLLKEQKPSSFSHLVWAVKEALMKLIPREVKFFVNLIPVSLDIAATITALTDGRGYHYWEFPISVGSKPTPTPRADFTFSPSEPKVNEAVYFTDRSTDPDNDITSWSWDFGDGATSTSQNPSHSYSKAWTYTVRLTVKDRAGNSDSTSKAITVTAPSPPLDPRAKDAVECALKAVGQTHQPNGEPWRGWGLRFVANAYGAERAGWESAYKLYEDLNRQGKVSQEPTIPLGALVFWDWTGEIFGVWGRWGHVGIYVGDGDVVLTPFGPFNAVSRVAINNQAFPNGGFSYLGWALAPDVWPGGKCLLGPTPTPTTGTIVIEALLDGRPWEGPIAIRLSGPDGDRLMSLNVPRVTSYNSPGTWTLEFRSGGPGEAIFKGITPSPTQSLTAGGTITFTLNFAKGGKPDMPDLWVESIYIEPEDFSCGDRVKIWVMVRNEGMGDAVGTFRTNLYFDGNLIGYYDKDGLAGGRSIGLPFGDAFDWFQEFTWPTDDRHHTIRAVVDVNNTIKESNEANNELSREFRAKCLVLPPHPCIPSLISPGEGAIMDNGRTDRLDDIVWDFDWSDCEGATQYHLFVKHPDATIPAINDDTTVASSYHNVSRGSFISDQYRYGWIWKVRAKVNGQWSEWSEIRTFNVEPVNTDPPQQQEYLVKILWASWENPEIFVDPPVATMEVLLGSPTGWPGEILELPWLPQNQPYPEPAQNNCFRIRVGETQFWGMAMTAIAEYYWHPCP